jgi:hypothetical protein
MKIFTFLIFLLSTTVTYADKILFYTDLIRHGGRTTLYPLKDIQYPALWLNHHVLVKQLTMYGLQEGIIVGQGVRRQCAQDTACHLLSSTYDSNYVCIRTTGVNRSIMTAQGALMSIYPTISQQLNNNAFMKIYPVVAKKDNLLSPHKTYSTPGLDHAKPWQEQWRSSQGYALYKRLYHINSNFFPHGICHFNSKNRSYKRCLSDIYPIGDNVQTLRNYCQANRQCSVQKILGLNQTQQNQVMAAYAWYAIHSFLPTRLFSTYRADYQVIGIARGARLVSEIAHNMKSVIDQPTKRFPYVLYSAHDATLFGTLSYLLAVNPSGNADSVITAFPGFVSDIRFLLYENENKQLMVKVIYFKNAQASKNNQGIVVLKEPFQQFYTTYYLTQSYKTISNKSSCDYIFQKVLAL